MALLLGILNVTRTLLQILKYVDPLASQKLFPVLYENAKPIRMNIVR